ncbi:MAG: EcsC family protein, partial [Beijerinckiaceae bacterium]|nr:EcsC family protein [Beijerinckiaceae bacterium]
MNPATVEPSVCTGVDFPKGASRLSAEDLAALQRAMRDLERTSLAIRLSASLGQQASALASIVPARLSEIANRAAEAAIRSSLRLAMSSLAGKPIKDRRRMHKNLAILAGAAGGAFGLSSLAVELPVSTTI